MIFSSIKKYTITLRIHHWLKNLLVFSPLILAHQFDYDSIYMAVNAFICFCLTASLIYIINDLRDIKFDQLHSTKSLRPIASGSISKSSIFILITILSILSIILSLNINSNFSLILLSYFILTLLYTYGLKKIIYIDLIILTSFYIIRIIAGGFATDIAVTTWFIMFSFFIFLFLATIKRITEIQKYVDRDLIIMGKSYTKKDLKRLYTLTQLAQLTALVTLAFYIFISSGELYSNHLYLSLSIPVFYLWFNHILSITRENNMKDDPIIFSISDPISYISFILIIFIFIMSI